MQRKKFQPFTGELTTFGRRSGRPHTVLLGLVRYQGFVYTSTQDCSKRDWCLNLIKNPKVLVRIEKEVLSGIARPVVDENLRVKILQKLSGPSKPGKWPRDVVIEIRAENEELP